MRIANHIIASAVMFKQLFNARLTNIAPQYISINLLHEIRSNSNYVFYILLSLWLKWKISVTKMELDKEILIRNPY